VSSDDPLFLDAEDVIGADAMVVGAEREALPLLRLEDDGSVSSVMCSRATPRSPPESAPTRSSSFGVTVDRLPVAFVLTRNPPLEDPGRMRRFGICAVACSVLVMFACGGSDGAIVDGNDGDSGAPEGSIPSHGDGAAGVDGSVSDATAQPDANANADAETNGDASDAGADPDAGDAGTDPDAGDAGTDPDAGDAGTDAGDSGTSCPIVDPCTVGALVDGSCVYSPVDDGTACDDGNACNGADSCRGGVCTPGHPGTVRDDFEGATLDGTKWTTSTAIPQGSASVVQSGGVVTLTNRGHLVSAKQFDPAQGGVRVTAEWAFTNGGFDFVALLTRSDGQPGGSYGETNEGVECALASTGEVTLRKRTAAMSSEDVSGAGSLGLATNDKVILEMFDDGTNVTCTARRESNSTRVSVTSAFTTTFAKNHVVVHNRENSEGEHTGNLDNITIEGGVSKRPFAQWTFDDTISSTVLDWAAAHDGTFGSTGQRVAAPAGFGSAANVIGDANSYFDFGDALGALGTSDFSLVVWMNASQAGIRDFLGNRDSSSGGQYLGIRMSNTGFLSAEVYGSNAPGGGLSSPTFVGGGEWHHVVLRRSGATLTWFVDGAQAGTGAIDGVPNISSTTHFLFGKSPFNDQYTNYATGSIDDLRLYDYALESCEVRNVRGVP
jgi:hypothetical protein